MLLPSTRTGSRPRCLHTASATVLLPTPVGPSSSRWRPAPTAASAAASSRSRPTMPERRWIWAMGVRSSVGAFRSIGENACRPMILEPAPADHDQGTVKSAPFVVWPTSRNVLVAGDV